MKITIPLTVLALLFLPLLSGCKTTDILVEPNEDVLIYDLPLDLTYLRVIEAIEAVPGWELMTTDKEKGLIGAYNLAYGDLLHDADRREISFLVKRVDSGKTSVQIRPEDQTVRGGDVLLKAVSDILAEQY